MNYRNYLLLSLLLFISIPNFAARSSLGYDLRPGKPFFRYVPYERTRPLINKTKTGFFATLNGVIHYWRPTQRTIRIWPTRDAVCVVPSGVQRIIGLYMHPDYGKIVQARLHSSRVVFLRMDNGQRIVKWGAWKRAGRIQKYRNRYVFGATRYGRVWSYFDTRTGKTIRNWGSYFSITPIVRAGRIHFFAGRSRGRGWRLFVPETGRFLPGEYSRVEDEVFTVDGRQYVKGRKHRERGYGFFNIRTGEPLWGVFRSIGGVFRTRRRHLFVARRDRLYGVFDIRTGRELIRGARNVRLLKRAGDRYFVRIIRYRDGSRTESVHDLDSLREYGKGYGRINRIQKAAGRYYFKARKDGKWYYVDLESNRPVGSAAYSVGDELARAGRDWYYSATRREDGVSESYYVNIRTGRITGGRHAGRIRGLQRAGRRYLFQVLERSGKYYVDLATGRRIGDKYGGIGKIYHAGDRPCFNAVTLRPKQYFVVDARNGRRIHGPYRYLYLDRSMFKVGSRYVFRARTGKHAGYHDFRTGRYVWGKYSGNVGDIFTVKERQFFSVRTSVRGTRQEAYLDTRTGEPVGGYFRRVYRLKNFSGNIVFRAQEKDRRFSFYNLLTGKRLWGPFDRIFTDYREIGKTVVFRVQQGRSHENRKMFYIDSSTGKPWGGVFDEVKQLSMSKGMYSYLARTGDNWKTIYPFNTVAYDGMRFFPGAKRLYPSRMSVARKKGRVMGVVRLKNTFREGITVRLELSSPAFPAFYGKTASILGAEIKLAPGKSVKQPLLLPFSEKFWNLYQKKIINCTLTAKVKTDAGRSGEQKIDLNVTIASRDRMKWDDIRNIAVYANIEDPTIKELARVVQSLGLVRNWQVSPRIDKPLKAYEVCRTLGLNYSFMSLGLGDEDTIKMPYEIIKQRLGKCTDTTILYATLLSRLGFSTIITTYTYGSGNRKISHLMLLIDTGVDARYARFLAKEKRMLVVPKGMRRCYIPIETTGMVSEGGKSLDFLTAWKRGLAQYRQHEAQILDPKNSFRLQSAWRSGFEKMTPDVKTAFRFPEKLLGPLKRVLRGQQYSYVKKILEDPAGERRLKSRGQGFTARMALGRYYYRVRRFMDAGLQFRAAVKAKPADMTALYYYLSTIVYAHGADDPRLSQPQRNRAARDFPVYAVRLSRLLKAKSRGSRSESLYAMNYDLGKWYNAFSQGGRGGVHTALAKEIRARIDRKKAVRYTAASIRRLRTKGFSTKKIREMQRRGFSEKLVVALVMKGFSEEMVYSLASKGFSEDLVLSLSSKGFSEDMVYSLASKGFSEDQVLSLAVKGYSEEAWSVSR